MKWVTWEHIGVDRMGSAWLIVRFVDPQAEFVFIAFGVQPPYLRTVNPSTFRVCACLTEAGIAPFTRS